MKYQNENAGTLLGVEGRYFRGAAPSATNFTTQKFITERRPIRGYDNGATIYAEIRFDDQCRNGQQSFAITSTVLNAHGRDIAGGCLHDDITQVFPELAPLIKWHLFDANGPMHYLANTLFLAGDRDCNGLRKGEPSAHTDAVYFGGVPIAHPLRASFADFLRTAASFDFNIIEVAHRDQGKPGVHQFAPKYTFGGYGTEWHECPFDTKPEAEAWRVALIHCTPQFRRTPTAWSEGKARELDAARSTAVWPEATDEQLSQPREALRADLEARLPALIADFRADMDRCGLYWSVPE